MSLPASFACVRRSMTCHHGRKRNAPNRYMASKVKLRSFHGEDFSLLFGRYNRNRLTTVFWLRRFFHALVAANKAAPNRYRESKPPSS